MWAEFRLVLETTLGCVWLESEVEQSGSNPVSQNGMTMFYV
jgi:hypothetical protein